jgi:hypothetical protein
MESDSELSVLASSLFNCIGIEGVKSSKIKIGGITGISSLGDQDGQGNVLEDVGGSVGGRVGGRIAIPGTYQVGKSG